MTTKGKWVTIEWRKSIHSEQRLFERPWTPFQVSPRPVHIEFPQTRERFTPASSFPCLFFRPPTPIPLFPCLYTDDPRELHPKEESERRPRHRRRASFSAATRCARELGHPGGGSAWRAPTGSPTPLYHLQFFLRILICFPLGFEGCPGGLSKASSSRPTRRSYGVL